MGKIQQTHLAFLGIVGISYIFFGVLWFIIIIGLKLRIKAWGWIPIFLLAFFEFSKVSRNLDPWTLYLLPKYFKTNQENPEMLLNMWFLYISEFWKTKALPIFEKTGTEQIRRFVE